MTCFAPGLFAGYTQHRLGNLKQDVLFKKLGFEDIGVNSHGVVEGYLSSRLPTGSGENLFHHS